MTTESKPPAGEQTSLPRTREAFERALDASGVAVWETDLVSGRVYLSRNWAAMLGGEARETVTTIAALKELVHPDDVELLLQRQAEVVRGLRTHYAAEHRVRMASGGWKWILSRGTVSERDPATGHTLRMCGTNVDIDEFKRLEEKLTQSEEEQQRILDSAPAEIAYIDRDEKVAFGNRTYLERRFVSAKQVVGRPMREVIGEGTYAAIRPRVARALSGHSVEFELQSDDYGEIRERSVRFVPDTTKEGGVRGFFYLAIDITDRKRTEHALAESEERFRGLTRLSSDWYWEQDAQYRFTYVSEGFKEHFGLDPARLLGERLQEAGGIDLVGSSWEENRARLDARQPFRDVLLQHRAGNGTVRYARISGEPTFDSQGSFLGYQGVGRDVTAEVRAEEELKAAKLAAEHANQAKSDFLSNMSHELRTPLGAILGFGQLLEEDAAALPGALHSQWVGSIVRAGWHLLGLVNEVLDLARIEAGRIELSLDAVALDDLIDECQGEIAPVATKREITVVVADPGTTLYVRADRMRLRQVLLNLLSNAVKYNRDQGEVRISARAIGTVVRIAVADSGQGIAKERMGELFQPFKRLGAERSKVEGFGLGLSITRRLVEMMGGAMGVESEPGRGSTFWFELPSMQPDEPQTAGLAPSADAEDSLKAVAATVLCVEDDPANQKLIQAVFSRWKRMRLLLAQDGTQGLDLALNGRPDLILLDIDLPGLNGYEIMRVLRDREHTKRIPVIGVSARAMPADMELALGASFHAYLTKPYQLRDLQSAIESALVSVQA